MSFLDYVRKQEAKDRCGRWPFNFPRSFPFTPMCKKHDDAYERVRNRFLKQNHAAHSVADLKVRMKAQKLEDVINAIDAVFYKEMLNETSRQVWYKRPVYRAFAELFKAIVGKLGYKVWKYGTIRHWLEAQS